MLGVGVLNGTFWFFGVDYCIGLIGVLGSELNDD
jgi:hypothetical protein